MNLKHPIDGPSPGASALELSMARVIVTSSKCQQSLGFEDQLLNRSYVHIAGELFQRDHNTALSYRYDRHRKLLRLRTYVCR